MKVHFAATTWEFEDHIETYNRILKQVRQSGHTVTREWIQEELDRRKSKKPYSNQDYRDIWLKVKASILSADLVIVEASQNTFALGYQVAIAHSNKKPTLVLANNNEISRTIITGEDNPLLHVVIYGAAGPEKAIKEFLDTFTTQRQEMRFNMMLDRETQTFLDNESYRTGRTKARIIRDLIRQDIAQKTRLS